MTKKSLIAALPLAAIFLAGCAMPGNSSSVSSSVDDYDVKWITPAGAPTLAFYDQGNNENWVSTSDTTSIAPNLGTDNYDALVFDGVNALRAIQNNQYEWKLAAWLTGGNFHLVSTKHSSNAVPTAESTFLSFNSGNLPDLVFKKLAADSWNWDFEWTEGGNITYVNGTAAVSQQLASNPDAYDYYFIAEPSLTNAKATLANLETPVTVNEIYDLRAEWSEYSGQSAIPQAGLFINNNSYAAHKGALDAFIEETGERLDHAAAGDAVVTESLLAYSNVMTEQAARFGFHSNLVGNLQKDGANKFGIVKSTEITDNRAFVNTFYEKLNGTTDSFGADLFL